MPYKITKVAYACIVCDQEYASEEDAKACEEKSVTHDRGVNANDLVLITSGEGTGSLGVVNKVLVFPREYGERYWHTVGLNVDVVDSYGSRILTFDAYAVPGEAQP